MATLLEQDLQQKYDTLRESLASLGSAAVAFSAGVDSTLLLAVANDVLGEKAVAFTAVSPASPERETDAASQFCADRGIRQISFAIDELSIEGFDHNPANRCYLCKSHLYREILARAKAEGLIHVIEGSNVDDLGDYRPGRQALSELGIESPLLESGFTKSDIRELSRVLGLPTFDKPAMACLYSRFAYGELMTSERLKRVDAAEQFLIDRGFATVRVRSSEDSARIEVEPQDIARLVQEPMRSEIVRAFTDLGFKYVAADLRGYRMGSMNASLDV